MQRGGRRGRGARGLARGRGRGNAAAIHNVPLGLGVQNEGNDSGEDELQAQIDEFLALPADINDDIPQEFLEEEEEEDIDVNFGNLGLGQIPANLPVDPAVAPANVPTHVIIAALNNNDNRINGRVLCVVKSQMKKLWNFIVIFHQLISS